MENQNNITGKCKWYFIVTNRGNIEIAKYHTKQSALKNLEKFKNYGIKARVIARTYINGYIRKIDYIA